MSNGAAHQRFHEIALEAKKRLARTIERAAADASDADDCSCIRDLAEAFSILPLPHQHDGGPPHTHPAPPGHPHRAIIPLPPELQERLNELLQEAASELSPEALHDQLHDLQRAVSDVVLALVRAIRDGASKASTPPRCRCLLAMAESIDLLLMAQMSGGMVPHTHDDVPPVHSQ